MILEKDGKKILLLNLEKQVQKNKEDIEYIINEEGALNQFGLRVVGQVETIGDMPTVTDYKTNNPNWQYGDAYIAGASQIDANIVDVTDATLLVLTRANTVYPNDFWMNLGEFPKPGPTGPEGKQGEQGIQGEHGLDVSSGSGVPTRQARQGTTYINASTGDVYNYSNKWDLIGNIKGPQGATGATGPQGKQGPIGQTGAIGPQGPRGIGVNILGTLTSTSQLPDPTTVNKDSAYIIPVDGVNHLYVIEGTDSLVWTDFGTAGIGEKGDKGDAGIGIDTMTDLDLTYGDTTVTYDTTDGLSINGQARFTYNGGTTKDVTMDVSIPVVPGDGIVIDKKSGSEQVEVKVNERIENFFNFSAQQKLIGFDNNENYALYELYGPAPGCIPVYNDDLPTLSVITDGNEDGSDQNNLAAVSKDYAERNFVAKQTTTTANRTFIYAYDSTGDKQFGMRMEPDANTIPFRGTNGVLKVGTPIGVNDATTKAYVDGLHHYTHTIAITGTNAQVYITLAIKGYPNPATALDADSTKVTVAELLAEATGGSGQPIMATGIFDVQYHVIAVYEQNKKVYIRYFDDNGCSFEDVALSDTETVTVADIVA